MRNNDQTYEYTRSYLVQYMGGQHAPARPHSGLVTRHKVGTKHETFEPYLVPGTEISNLGPQWPQYSSIIPVRNCSTRLIFLYLFFFQVFLATTAVRGPYAYTDHAFTTVFPVAHDRFSTATACCTAFTPCCTAENAACTPALVWSRSNDEMTEYPGFNENCCVLLHTR